MTSMWVMANIKPPGIGPRVLSMFPFTRAIHVGYIFLTTTAMLRCYIPPHQHRPSPPRPARIGPSKCFDAPEATLADAWPRDCFMEPGDRNTELSKGVVQTPMASLAHCQMSRLEHGMRCASPACGKDTCQLKDINTLACTKTPSLLQMSALA